MFVSSIVSLIKQRKNILTNTECALLTLVLSLSDVVASFLLIGCCDSRSPSIFSLGMQHFVPGEVHKLPGISSPQLVSCSQTPPASEHEMKFTYSFEITNQFGYFGLFQCQLDA